MSPFSLPILHDFKQRTKRREYGVLFPQFLFLSIHGSVGNIPTLHPPRPLRHLHWYSQQLKSTTHLPPSAHPRHPHTDCLTPPRIGGVWVQPYL